MKVALGCDHAGYGLKREIAGFLAQAGHAVTDFGCHSEEPTDYPDIARAVAEAVAGGEYERGILICGTGIGMAIAANKVRGIRAACCSESFSARSSRQHNDANVLTLGARVIGPGLAREIVAVWMETAFSGDERHARRVAKIAQMEQPCGAGDRPDR